MRVRVYKNLHKSKDYPVYSVKSMEGEDYGRVIDHVRNIVLKDVTFIVSEAGRQRVLRDKRKNVHAFVQGTVIDEIPTLKIYNRRMYYNPYSTKTFIDPDDKPVESAKYAVLCGQGVFAI